MATATTERPAATGSNSNDRDRAGGQAPVRERVRAWAAEGVAGAAVQIRKDGRSTLYRCRRQLLPHAVAATVLGLGLGTQAVNAERWANPASVTVITGVASYTAALVAARRARLRRPVWARRVKIGGLGAATWLTLSTVVGVGHVQAGILLAGELAVAARWWQVHRIDYPRTGDDTDQPADQNDTDAWGDGADDDPDARMLTAILESWADKVAGQSGPLPKSVLTDAEHTRTGWAFKLLLDPGKQTYDTAMPLLGKIASGLVSVGVGVEDLILERFPGEKSPAICRLQILTESPIAGDITFTGPRRLTTPDGGVLLELGPFADGDGEALWRLYTEDSMWSGFVLGGTGMGKSRLIENIVISAMAGGDTEFWFIDPQSGGSSPLLRQHADYFNGPAGYHDALTAALEIVESRSEENSVEGWTGFHPTRHRPGLLIVIDECHNVFDARDDTDIICRGKKYKVVEAWAKVAREGRKVGVALLCVSQYPGLETFGGSEALRSSIMTGNTLAMHVRSNSAKNMMPGLDVDPKTLPPIPGYAFLQGNPEAGLRTAPFRNRNTKGVAEKWMAKVCAHRPGLDALSVTATRIAGDAYIHRHTSAASGQAASAARIAAMRAGTIPADIPTAPAPAPAPAKRPTAAPVRLGKVITFPTWAETVADAEQQAPQPAYAAAGTSRDQAPSTPSTTRELIGSRQTVWDAVAAGVDTPAALVTHTGLSRRRVQEILSALVHEKHLTRVGPGRYHTAA